MYNRMGRHARPIVFQFSSFTAVLLTHVVFFSQHYFYICFFFFHVKFEELKYASGRQSNSFSRNNGYPSASPDKERRELHAYYSYTLCTGTLRNRIAQLPGETTRRHRIWETKL